MAEKLKRVKAYPNPIEVGKKALANGAAAGIASGVFLGLMHASPDLINTTHFDKIFMLGGFAHWAAQSTDYAVTHGIDLNGFAGFHQVTPGLVDSVANATPAAFNAISIAGHSFPHDIAHAIPDALTANPVAQALHLNGNDLLAIEGVAVGTAVGTAGVLGANLLRPSGNANLPPTGKSGETDAYDAADDIIGALAGRRKGILRREVYENLDQDQIAVEVQTVYDDLKKADISKEAVWANTAGHIGAPALRAILDFPFVSQLWGGSETMEKWAANQTMRKEEYRRMKGGGLGGYIFNFGETLGGRIVKKVPFLGNGFDAFSNFSEQTVGRFFNKRDVFGDRHTAADAGFMDLVAAVVGTAMPLPGFTSSDVEEFWELFARPMLESDEMNDRVFQAAARIAGDKVRRLPRSFSNYTGESNRVTVKDKKKKK